MKKRFLSALTCAVVALALVLTGVVGSSSVNAGNSSTVTAEAATSKPKVAVTLSSDKVSDNQEVLKLKITNNSSSKLTILAYGSILTEDDNSTPIRTRDGESASIKSKKSKTIAFVTAKDTSEALATTGEDAKTRVFMKLGSKYYLGSWKTTNKSGKKLSTGSSTISKSSNSKYSSLKKSASDLDFGEYYVIDQYIKDGKFTESEWKAYVKKMGGGEVGYLDDDEGGKSSIIYFDFNSGYSIYFGDSNQVDTDYAYVCVTSYQGASYDGWRIVHSYRETSQKISIIDGGYMPVELMHPFEDTIRYMNKHPDGTKKPTISGLDFMDYGTFSQKYCY